MDRYSIQKAINTVWRVNKIHVKQGAQALFGVVMIQAIFSPPSIWNAMSLNPYFFNPMLISIYFSILVMSRAPTKLPIVRISHHLILYGAVTGTLASLAVLYLTVLINGGHYNNTVQKAIVLIALSSIVLFIQTIIRFKYPSMRFPMLFSSIIVGLTTCGTYYTPASTLYKAPLYILAYMVIAAAIALIVCTFIFPTTTGTLSREQLGHGLRKASRLLVQLVDLTTGDVKESNGRLVKATGKIADIAMGIDSGLVEDALDLHFLATRAGRAIQDASAYAASARFEIEIYRPTHVFPFHSYYRLAILARSFLSNISIAIYSVQSGKLNAGLLHQHRERLLVAARAVQNCCIEFSNCLTNNEPVEGALGALQGMMEVLDEVNQGILVPPERALDEDAMALHIVLDILFTAASRIIKMYRLLPAALARDQPTSACKAAPVLSLASNWEDSGALAKILGAGAAAGGSSQSQVDKEQQAATMERCKVLNVLERSLSSSLDGSEDLVSIESYSDDEKKERLKIICGGVGSPRSPLSTRNNNNNNNNSNNNNSRDGGDDGNGAANNNNSIFQEQQQGEGRCLEVVKAPEIHRTTVQQTLKWLNNNLGITNELLRLALQQVITYIIIMIFTVIPSINENLYRPVWAMIVVVVLFEPNTGSTIRKGVMRGLGTLVGAGVGLALLYLGYALNGGDSSDTVYVQKFIVISVGLALWFGLTEMLAAADPDHFYGYLTTNLLVPGIALSGYTLPSVDITIALWRMALTGIGILVVWIVILTVFPVTARSTLAQKAEGVLNSLAECTDAVFRAVVPDHQHDSGSSGGSEGGEQEAQQRSNLDIEQGGGGSNTSSGISSSTNNNKNTEGLAAKNVGELSPRAEAHADEQPGILPAEEDTAQRLELVKTGADNIGSLNTNNQPPPQNQNHHHQVQAWTSIHILPHDRVHAPTKTRWELWRAAKANLSLQPGPHLLLLDETEEQYMTSQELLGAVYMQLVPKALGTSVAITSLVPLIKAVKYEVSLFPRISHSNAFKLQRLCRYYLNVLSHFASSMDAYNVKKLEMLGVCHQATDNLLQQIGQGMKGIFGLLATSSSSSKNKNNKSYPDVQQILMAVKAVEAHAANVLLLSQLQCPSEGFSESQRTATLAFIVALAQISWAMRHICLAVVKGFHARDKQMWKKAVEELVAFESQLVEDRESARVRFKANVRNSESGIWAVEM